MHARLRLEARSAAGRGHLEPGEIPEGDMGMCEHRELDPLNRGFPYRFPGQHPPKGTLANDSPIHLI